MYPRVSLCCPIQLLALTLLVSVTASPDLQQGSWTNYLNSLPDSKLPPNPILGNGRLGIILDSSSHQRNSTPTGPGQINSLDLYMNTNSFWSCTSCNPSIDPDNVDTSCCTVVTLGGVSVRLTPTFTAPLPSFSASQILANASLTTTFPTPGGGAIFTTTVVHPTETLTVTTVSSSSSSSPITLDIATWVHQASGAGGGPTPWRVGCASATTGAEGPCTPASLAFASRNASTRNALVMPVIGALASGLQLGPGASVVATHTDPSGGNECVHTITLPPGSWVAVITGVGITRGPGLSDPMPLAVGRVMGALNGGGAEAVAQASLAHWKGVWGVSGVSLPTRPLAEALFYGAVYVLEGASPTSSSPDDAAPGLYGPWASQDNPAWQGDFTLDYNYNAPFYGSFASGHGDQVEGYWDALSAWIPSGQKKAQAQAKLAHITTCPATALYYNCHLAPWGQSSLDPMSKFMTWNLPHALLPMINHFEYTQNLSFAASTIYPLLSGVMDWYGCYLAFNASTGLWSDFNAFNEDMEHEEQPALNPTIALSLIQRVASATVEMAVALGLTPPDSYTSIATHLTPPSTLNQSVVGPGGVWYPLNNTRCSDVTASWTFYNVPTLDACEAACDGTGGCSLISYCPPPSVNNASGCTGEHGQPAPNTCWGMPIDQLIHCTNTSVSPGNTGWTSGYRAGGSEVNITSWNTFQGGGMGSMDSFAFYPNWPSESIHPSSPYTPPSTQTIARVTAALVGGDFVGGRGVDVLTAAVRAGRSQGNHTPSSAYDGFTPLQVLQGMDAYLGRWFGRNQLAYAPGGGIENTGMIRAVTEMLLQSYPNTPPGAPCMEAGGCGYTQALFPFWPRNESASFWGLGGKGGVIVDAVFDGGMGAVASPFNATAKFTRGGAPSTTLYFLDPWGVGPAGRVAVDCADSSAPTVSWNGDGTVLSFLAPLGVACKVGIV